jgi:hypothetical protein
MFKKISKIIQFNAIARGDEREIFIGKSRHHKSKSHEFILCPKMRKSPPLNENKFFNVRLIDG